MKNQKGITLVALIITIIVLLILAVVAVSNMTDYGILDIAKNTADTWNKVQENELGMLNTYKNYLQNEINNNDSTGNFLRIQKDSWGNSGSNGGTVSLNMTNQKASGNIVVDSISKLIMNLANGSSFSGAINSENTGEIELTLDSSSSITLTGDTYVKSLTNADTTNSNIHTNGYKLYVNGAQVK